MDTDLKKRLDELEKKVKSIDEKRIFQQDVIPGAIKMRAMGEANRFVRVGTRPTIGETATDSTAMHFDESTGVLSIWDGSAWLETTLT